MRCCFRDAGHILGSAVVEVWVTEQDRTRKLVFSGDLGQPGRPIVRDPTRIETADVLLVESTYGNRLHRPLKETIDELVFMIEDTLRRRQGNIIIPAFALGRTQELQHLLVDLCRQGRLPRLQVFVDSPMADKVTEITWKHKEFLDDETPALLSLRQRHPEWLDLRFTRTVEESIALNRIKSGAIIISASGMCDAGRIRHHLRHHLGQPECAIVIIGYQQAAGTLGRRLVDGYTSACASTATTSRCGPGALLTWLSGFTRAPARTFVIHGEAETACGFADLLSERLRWDVGAPTPGTRVDL